MSTKTGRRNLRHARIGEAPSSGRSAFNRDRITTRLLCVEFRLSEDVEEEPIELFFKPIPVSVVMKLQGLKREASFEMMLDILAKYVVDPQTGQSVATAEEWDAFGIDGVQAAIQAMVDGSRGGGGEGQGPTSAASTEAVYQAAKEMMQGDPAMAEAFRRAAEETTEESSQTADNPGIVTVGTETETEGGIEMQETLVSLVLMGPTLIPTEPPNGTSDETP